MSLLWLIPALPLMGFVVLGLWGGLMTRRGIAAVALTATGLSLLVALLVAADFLLHAPARNYFTQPLWHWIATAGLSVDMALYLDPLALVMMLVVTGVGFLIHLYSAEHMAAYEGYRRYFAYLNLFVAAMLTLVLADNLLLLFLGWEGVGLCSYLLIGFWYRDSANGRAARKAFIVTRVADTAFVIGLLLLFTQLGTLQIQVLMMEAAHLWPSGSALATTASALLLIGALGKSAQLPFQVWLPDAMAGPTPVSALIHAATMVTAGVYLIARCHTLFDLAPGVMALLALIGALTLLLAAGAALAQRDIKRILAYSTISQIGYMFLALGVGAWTAAIFHFMTHAFFKALLFLSAGVTIQALGEEHDIYRMGGLRKTLPSAFWGFVIGGASLAALPLLTAGFYSKEQILHALWISPQGGPWWWLAAWLGALLTGVYIFRPIFVAFFGAEQTAVTRRPGLRQTLPLTLLAILSLLGGLLWMPAMLGNVRLLPQFLATSMPPLQGETGFTTEWLLMLLASGASLAGIFIAYELFWPHPGRVKGDTRLAAWAKEGWDFDRLYEWLWLRPYLQLSHAVRGDVIDAAYEGLARASCALHDLLSSLQNGLVRRYAAGVAVGALLLISVTVLLL
jgi:NADH-quinone oxidoreductase subunit L